jgi:hypothetical protein
MAGDPPARPGQVGYAVTLSLDVCRRLCRAIGGAARRSRVAGSLDLQDMERITAYGASPGLEGPLPGPENHPAAAWVPMYLPHARRGRVCGLE